MTEDQLKKYLPKYGDRIAVMGFSKRVSQPRESLIERIKRKMDEKHTRKSVKNTEDKLHTKKLIVQKPTRQIEAGWLHYSVKDKDYRQVKAHQGGGNRKLTVDRNSNCDSIFPIIKEKFFPNGISTKGSETDFTFKLLDFKRHEIENEISIQEMYDISGFTRLRFYLATKDKDVEYKPQNSTTEVSSSYNLRTIGKSTTGKHF